MTNTREGRACGLLEATISSATTALLPFDKEVDILADKRKKK